MSPTGVAALLLLALVVDYMSLGPNSIRDRLAFCMAVVAFRVGFNGSQLDRWTVDKLALFIDLAKNAAGDAYIAQAVTSQVIGIFVGVLFLYTIACMLPNVQFVTKKLGKFSSWTFPTTGVNRINWKLWVCAFGLGLMAELANGWVGSLTLWFVDLLTFLCTPLPNLVFGVS